MIIRFKSIEGVGPFISDHPGPVQFAKVTLIHGLNCMGKTSLTDIFIAFAYQDDDLLKKRLSRTTTGPASSQTVALTYRDTQNLGEQAFAYNGQWTGTPLEFKLMTFDQFFVDTHVYRGASPDGETGQSLYDFVVGGEAVRLANTLEIIRKSLDEVRRELRTTAGAIQSRFPSTGSDVRTFVELVVYDPPVTLQTRAEELRRGLGQVAAQLTQIEPLRQLSLPRDLPDIHSRLSQLRDFNILITRPLDVIPPTVGEKVEAHLSSHFRLRDGGERNWLTQGFLQYLGENEFCPFCGQSLSLVQEWLETLRAFLNQNLRDNLILIRNEIPSVRDNLLVPVQSPIPSLRENQDRIMAFLPFLTRTNPQFDVLEAACQNTSRLCESAFLEYQSMHEQLRGQVLQKAQAKLSRPEEIVEPYDEKDFQVAEESYTASMHSYNQVLQQICGVFEQFQSGLGENALLQTRAEHTAQLRDTERNLERLGAIDFCLQWRDQNAREQQLALDFQRQELELEQHITAFLSQYGSDLNETYRSLGNQQFDLHVESIRPARAHRPRFVWNPSLHGHTIPPENHRYFFSESDRRGLALALFLTLVRQMPDAEAAKTILILDDPFTSFDDNRTRSGLMLLSEIARKTRQVIVLSHHTHFSQAAIQKFKASFASDFSLIQIIANGGGSKLQSGNIEAFLRTPHQGALEELETFVAGGPIGNTKSTLRIVLEHEFSQRFYRQLRSSNLLSADLSAKIDGLRDNRTLSTTTADKLHNFRTSLNPDHHEHTLNDANDLRSLADELLIFIFVHLRPV